MIVQVCLNGARPAGFHPALPVTPRQLTSDARACLAAGASELHVHPRTPAGTESLSAVDTTVAALRHGCPGTLIGVSTGAWIENDVHATRQRISDWRHLPDYASVNFSEADAPAIASLLLARGVAVEAGLASVEDAQRLLMHPEGSRVFRVLIEIEQQQVGEADAVADEIIACLDDAGYARPRLLHGFDATTWHFVQRAARLRYATRIGLEDGAELPDGTVSTGNEDLVKIAVQRFRQALAA